VLIPYWVPELIQAVYETLSLKLSTRPKSRLCWTKSMDPKTILKFLIYDTGSALLLVTWVVEGYVVVGSICSIQTWSNSLLPLTQSCTLTNRMNPCTFQFSKFLNLLLDLKRFTIPKLLSSLLATNLFKSQLLFLQELLQLSNQFEISIVSRPFIYDRSWKLCDYLYNEIKSEHVT